MLSTPLYAAMGHGKPEDFQMPQDGDIWDRIWRKYFAARDISVRFGRYNGFIKKKGWCSL